MKARLMVLGLLFSAQAALGYSIGETVPNLCWENERSEQVCLDDFQGYVKVLDYGAGWCGPCNSKMAELARRVGEFTGQKVVFFSNSIHGWSKPSQPSPQFLREWRARHNIPASMQVVAVAQISELYEFSPEGYIPSLSVLDGNNKMTFQQVNASVSTLFAHVRQLLQQAGLPQIAPVPFVD